MAADPTMGYLDSNGLLYFWQKIKTYVTGHVPSKTSDLTNDSGYITINDVPPGSVASSTTPNMDGTASAGSENAFARGDHIHPTDTSRAPLASPAFTGVPTAPTAQFGEDTTQIATTAFVQDAVEDVISGIQGTYALLTDVPAATSTTPKMDGTAAVGSETTWAKGDHIHPTDTSRAPLASPAFTGTPTVPTPIPGNESTQIANTEFVVDVANDVVSLVEAEIPSATSTTPQMDGTAAVGSEARWAKGDHVHPTDTSRAPLASPAFTGTPTAPTAAAGTNTTQIATTAFVKTAVDNKTVPSPSSADPEMDGTAAAGSSANYARADHVHPTDTSRAAASHNHAAGDITSGELSVARGGTGKNTLTSGAALIGNGTSAVNLRSITNNTTATAPTTSTNLITMNTLKNAIGVSGGAASYSHSHSNATQSAAGYMSSADKTKLDAFGAASTYALKTDISGAYIYKGSVATEADLPNSGRTAGDVYNIVAASSYGAAGTNVAWTGTDWDALGAYFSITAITNTEIDTIVAS